MLRLLVRGIDDNLIVVTSYAVVLDTEKKLLVILASDFDDLYFPVKYSNEYSYWQLLKANNTPDTAECSVDTILFEITRTGYYDFRDFVALIYATYFHDDIRIYYKDWRN